MCARDEWTLVEACSQEREQNLQRPHGRGTARNPAPRRLLAWDSPAPGPALLELRVISLASLPRKGLAQARGGRSPQVPARPTRKPPAAPCAAAPADLNTPAGRAAFPELGAPRAPW